MAQVILNRNSDGTVTFRYGRYRESFSVDDKGFMETYEAIKYAAIAAGISLTDEHLEEFLKTAKRLHKET